MKRILFIAPHYRGEVTDGANIYCDSVLSAAKAVASVELLHANGIRLFEGGKSTDSFAGAGKVVSKHRAMARCSLKKGLYFTERLSGDFNADCLGALNKKYDLVIVSFLYVAFAFETLLSGFACPVLVLTHNYDLDMLDRTGRRSLFHRLAFGSQSERYRARMARLQSLGNRICLGSISVEDCVAYQREFPGYESVVIPAAVHAPHVVACEGVGVPRLAFLGSLDVGFNIEGLRHFERAIQGGLRDSLQFEFHVFGRNPSPEVRRMAARNGWHLHCDLPGPELDRRLSEMTVGILPFLVNQGLKLKIYHYLSVGLPVLGTSIFSGLSIDERVFCASDNVMDWSSFIDKVIAQRESAKIAHLYANSVGNSYQAETLEVITQLMVRKDGHGLAGRATLHPLVASYEKKEGGGVHP